MTVVWVWFCVHGDEQIKMWKSGSGTAGQSTAASAGSAWAPDGIAVGYDEQEKNWSAEINGERYGAAIERASFVG